MGDDQFNIVELIFTTEDLCGTLRKLRSSLVKLIDKCWGPSSSEGPQKHDLTMFPEL
jgi:hypothetical protein